jgi:hypothetical protein
MQEFRQVVAGFLVTAVVTDTGLNGEKIEGYLEERELTILSVSWQTVRS